MEFRGLAELGEKIEPTARRNEMVELASDFLKRLEPEEVEPAACMLLGRPFPNTSEERLDVSWATLLGIITDITGAGRKNMETAFGKSGTSARPFLLAASFRVIEGSCQELD